MAKTLGEPSKPSPSILIVGLESQIGSVLFERISLHSPKNRVYGTTRRIDHKQQSDRVIYLDLGDPDTFIEKGFRFDHVVFCAGITSIADCESNPTLCRRINAWVRQK